MLASRSIAADRRVADVELHLRFAECMQVVTALANLLDRYRMRGSMDAAASVEKILANLDRAMYPSEPPISETENRALYGDR